MTIDLQTIMKFFAYVLYFGSVLIAGKIYSQFLEALPFWYKVPTWMKTYIVLLIALVVSGVATFFLNLTPEALEAWKPYLIWIGTTLYLWYSSQKEHERLEARAAAKGQ